MNLLELQRRMSEDVRRPLTEDFEMQQEIQDGRSMSELAETYVKPNDRLTSFERLEIYNRQYWFRTIGAVSEDFPALAAVLSAKRFDALVLAYLKENPSTSFTLRNLGARLPLWLKDHPEFSPRRHALLLDVARLEWAYVESFDRAAVTPLTQEDFTGLDGESRLSLQPHLQLLDLQYPVDELVLAVHRVTPESDIMSNAVTERKATARIKLPSMRRTKIYLAIHRFDNSVYYRRIEREAYLLLSALQQRKTLAESIDHAFANSKLSPEEQAARIQQCFAHAAELGWFCQQPLDYIGIQ
ncbi:MAG TPA: DNA-binding domain-containing protein [Granulicella sp.]|jgi:hypothetical protein